MRKTSLSAFVIGSILINSSPAQAEISWGESITAGSTQVKASHINELRTQIQNLRTDVDAGDGGAWSSGSGGALYYNGGNVGIGIGSPVAKLHVNGSSLLDGTVTLGSDSSNPETRLYYNTTTGRNYFAPRLANNSGWDWSNEFGFHRSNSAWYFDGNVGIGTTAPGQKLDVNGTAQVRGDLRLNGAKTDDELNFESQNGFLRMAFNQLRFYDWGGGGDNMTINNGNVGIGTTSPSQKLDVSGNIRMNTGRSLLFGTGSQQIYGDNGSGFYIDSNHNDVSQLIFRDKQDDVYGRLYAQNGDSIGFLDGDGHWAMQIAKDNFIKFASNNSEKMRILNNGNVGIGTASPETALHVIKSGSSQPTAIFEQTGASPTIALVDATNGMRLEYHSGSDQLRVQSATLTGAYDSATVAAFGRNGNVGIGTTSPSQKLDVAGTVKATKFSGNGSGLTTLNASNISSGTLNLARIANNSIPAGKLAANSVGASEVANGSLVATTELSATGTKNSSTFLRGDNKWATVAGDNLGNHSATQDLYINNKALVSSGGSNYDFIKHDDSSNTWNFGSDRSDMNTGTSGGGSISTGNINLSSRNVNFGTGVQRIYGDNSSAFYIESNHSNISQQIFRDKEDTVYGRVYGGGNGNDFGLMDGDGGWAVLSQKDNNIQFRVNNSEKM